MAFAVKRDEGRYLNFHSPTFYAVKQDGTNLYFDTNYLTKPLLEKCRRIGYFKSSEHKTDIVEEAFIKSVTLEGSLLRVGCDRTLLNLLTKEEATSNGVAPDLLVLLENQSQGEVVYSNYFANGSSRVLVGARNCIYSKNIFNDTTPGRRCI